MWEIVHSIQVLATAVDEVAFGQWRRSSRKAGLNRWQALRTLAPPLGYFPDFLTPVPGSTDPREGVEAVLRTPQAVLSDELNALARCCRLPPWVGALADGEPELLRGLGLRLADYFRTTLASHWSLIRRTVNDELDRLGRIMTLGGVDALLAGASDIMRWDPPVITLLSKASDRDINLGGRGVILQPSFFASGDITPVDIPGKPLVLAYPVIPALGWFTNGPDSLSTCLHSLIGRTRTEALAILADRPQTTTDLATLLGMAPATISQHTKVLREAGLLRSEQRGKAVLHTASSIGVRLLELQGAQRRPVARDRSE